MAQEQKAGTLGECCHKDCKKKKTFVWSFKHPAGYVVHGCGACLAKSLEAEWEKASR